MIVRARAPLRLGLAGGGTDVSPYCDVHGGFVLNGTIDRYAYASIEPLSDPLVRFSATDLQISVDCDPSNSNTWDGQLVLHKAIYKTVIERFNGGKPLFVHIHTFCDAPAGSGLGSSSTLVVAMLKAYAELLNLPLDDHALASLAFQIERVDCGLQGGRQDQYSATFGGFNFMEFYADNRAVVNPIHLKPAVLCELEASILLFYTGVSRESAKIIAVQSSNVSDGRQDAVDAMHGIKREARVMKDCLLRGDLDGVIDSLRDGWQHKKNSASGVSTSQIEHIYSAAIEAGALAGKVSGAGGGGFMMFFVPPARRMSVMRTLSEFKGHTSNCHFTSHGAQAWKLP